MCGISCILRFPALSSPTGISVCPHGGIHRETLCCAVRRRGPDASRTLSFVPSRSSGSGGVSHVDATSAVLSLRGRPGGAPQPAVAPEDSGAAQASFLQWNGEVFGGWLDIPTGESDTAAVMRHLRQLEREQCASAPPLPDTTEEEEKERQRRAFATSCVRFFEFEVEGPYAFVYYAHSLGIFLIGRDPLGRRSLVTHASTVPRAATIFDGDVADHVDTDAKSENKSVELEFVIASVTAPHINESSSPVTVHASDSTSRPRRRLRENEEANNNHTKDSKKKEPYSDPDEDPGNDKDDETDVGCDCWRELPNTGLFLVDATGLAHFPWTRPHAVHPLLRFQLQPRRSLSVPSPVTDEWAAAHYLSALRRAVEVRVAAAHCGGDCARPIGILFSGGIDSTVLAALADRALPTATPIELINVAFGDAPELTPDRIAAFRAWAQLLAISRVGREWRAVFVDVAKGAEATDAVRRLVRPRGSVIDLSIGTALWHAAQGKGRMQRIYAGKDDTGAKEGEKEKKEPEEEKEKEKEDEEDEEDEKKKRMSNEHRHEAAATRRIPHKHIRLSGPAHDTAADKEHIILREEDKDYGGDPYAPLVSAIIAELESAGGTDAAAPVLLSTLGKDYAMALRAALSRGGHRRLGAYASAAAAEGAVAFARSGEASSKAVRLVRETDMSRVRRAAPALWLSRGDMSTKKNKNENDIVSGSGSGEPLGETRAAYVAESRVLLIGMGADETLGGYTRHRRAHERRGCAGLAEELRLDFARLWRRNLGRDDRAVGDSGREGRCPFLDEGVLGALGDIAAAAAAGGECGEYKEEEEVLRMAMAPVCDLERGGPGVGDKKILRRCAEMIGLGEVARLQKRAIQFGSRIAHAHPSK